MATQESSLGNPTGTSEPRNFEVDTAAPTVTLNAPESPSNNTTPSFAGRASESAPVTIQIYAGSTAEGPVISMAAATGNGGEWSSGRASPALASGQYTAVATQKSLLGNPAGTSEPRTFEVDTASPTVTLNAVTSPSNNTAPSFTGTASDTTPVVVHIYNAANSEVSERHRVSRRGKMDLWQDQSGRAKRKLHRGCEPGEFTREPPRRERTCCVHGGYRTAHCHLELAGIALK